MSSRNRLRLLLPSIFLTVATPFLGMQAFAIGGSAGGGGFVDENSTVLLKQVSSELARQISIADPSDFDDLPKGWTQELLAETIANIRSKRTVARSREGRALMFDYGIDQAGKPYLAALAPFFNLYANIPIKVAANDDIIRNTKADLQIKLVHEVAHLLGKGENDAETYARNLLNKMAAENVECVSSATQPFNDEIGFGSMKTNNVSYLAFSRWTTLNLTDPTKSGPVEVTEKSIWPGENSNGKVAAVLQWSLIAQPVKNGRQMFTAVRPEDNWGGYYSDVSVSQPTFELTRIGSGKSVGTLSWTSSSGNRSQVRYACHTVYGCIPR